MTHFEYISVALSIVFSLTVVRLLDSLSSAGVVSFNLMER